MWNSETGVIETRTLCTTVQWSDWRTRWRVTDSSIRCPCLSWTDALRFSPQWGQQLDIGLSCSLSRLQSSWQITPTVSPSFLALRYFKSRDSEVATPLYQSSHQGQHKGWDSFPGDWMSLCRPNQQAVHGSSICMWTLFLRLVKWTLCESRWPDGFLCQHR